MYYVQYLNFIFDSRNYKTTKSRDTRPQHFQDFFPVECKTHAARGRKKRKSRAIRHILNAPLRRVGTLSSKLDRQIRDRKGIKRDGGLKKRTFEMCSCTCNVHTTVTRLVVEHPFRVGAGTYHAQPICVHIGSDNDNNILYIEWHYIY